MKFTKIHNTLQTIVRAEINNLSPNSIVKIKENYIVFGKYRIANEHENWNVYERNDLVGSFSSSRSALSWCILDNLGNKEACRNLKFYDNFYSFKKMDLERFKRRISTTQDPQTREILAAKVSRSLLEKSQFKKQLNKCINLAKYYQLRGIDNEIARTNLNEQD